jgi:hypothetical protein
MDVYVGMSGTLKAEIARSAGPETSFSTRSASPGEVTYVAFRFYGDDDSEFEGVRGWLERVGVWKHAEVEVEG